MLIPCMTGIISYRMIYSASIIKVRDARKGESMPLSQCGQCGRNDHAEAIFCSECKSKQSIPSLAKEFPVVLDIHPDADLRVVMLEIVGWASLRSWMPSVDQFRAACLTSTTHHQRQCLYRRFELHLPGPRSHVCRPFKDIAREHKTSAGSTRMAVIAACHKVRHELDRMLLATDVRTA